MTKPLSDNQVGDLLGEALNVIGGAKAQTVRGNTALDAARQAISLMQIGLLMAAEKNSDVVDTVIEQPARRGPSRE
ncbi:hypothetical protein [Tardiphaga sp.]|uniref:hypothetical protein n=1 Tax=Tardiphaga sp. TaxID=1926292 RepID=UPI00260A7119|nr:hypothetical protein [Tardiphaga sp.]